MKKIFAILCASATALGVLGSAYTVFASEIVYSNTTTEVLVEFQGNMVGLYPPIIEEYGDQITLGGTNRLIDDFKFAFWLASASVFNGDETARIRFYANDSSGAPGTVLYDSGAVAFTPAVGDNYITLSNLSVLVPDTITWTVLFGGFRRGGSIRLRS